MNYNIKCGDFSAVISSCGAEVCSLKRGGKEYIWQGDTRFWNEHAPLLFPICGRLLNEKYSYGKTEYSLGIHGFLRFCEFKLIEKSASSVKLGFTSNKETRALYPFDFSVTAEYIISDCKIDFNFSVKNESDEIMPYMFGWHPGFNIPGSIEDCSLHFGKLDSLTVHPLQNEGFVSPIASEFPLMNGTYNIESEEKFYEADTLILTGHANSTELAFNSCDTKIKVMWSENLPYLCLWKSISSEAKFLCIEPWSGVPADGVTNEDFESRKMQRLEIGSEEKYSYSILIKE